MKSIIALVMIFAPLSVHAQLLKCVGKDGKVEYAAQCPGGTKEQQTGIRSTTSGPTTDPKADPKKAAQKSPADLKKQQAEQADTAAKKAEEAKNAEIRKVNCESARAQLAALQTGERMQRVDPKTGERSFLEDNERQKATAEAQASVASWCK